VVENPASVSPTVAAAGPQAAAPRDRMSGRATDVVRNVTAQQAAAGGVFILALLFLISLMVPYRFRIFGLLFQPYKLWLLIIFIPLIVMLLKGKAGKPMLVDWLMIGATVWGLLAYLKNHGFGFMVITGGTYVLEFLGAYLLARIAIRSGADFRRMVILLFVLVLILLPLAAIESITGNRFMAELIGPNWMPVRMGGRLGMTRTQVVFEHPILYGAFVSTTFGLIWYALIPETNTMTRMFLVSFIGFATIFSLSTGAFLAINVQLILIFWELATRPHPNRWRIFGWLVVIGYVTLDMVTTRSPFHSLVHYVAFSSQSSYNRILIFEFGMQNVKANPIFGLGYNDWSRPSWMNPSFDNHWLLFTMRHGIPAFLMFAAAIVLIVRQMARQPLIDPLDRACRAGYLTAIAGMILAGGTSSYWKQLLVYVMFIIGSGVWIFTGGAREPAGGADPVPPDNASDRPPRAGVPPRRGSAEAGVRTLPGRAEIAVTGTRSASIPR
jgi:O-antigen ligase